MLEDPSFSEAVQHLLPATLVVTGTDPDPDHPDHPIIYFAGEMETTSTSTMIGKVKMSPDDHITWHFVSLLAAIPLLIMHLNYCAW